MSDAVGITYHNNSEGMTLALTITIFRLLDTEVFWLYLSVRRLSYALWKIWVFLLQLSGDYVVVEPIDEGDKVKGEITNILYPDQIQHIKHEGHWYVMYGILSGSSARKFSFVSQCG